MNDKFLVGNEIIEQAIHLFGQDNADVNYFNVFEAIRRRMNEDGHLIIPVEYLENGNMNWLSIQGANEGAALAAFTSEDEVEKGQKSDLISHHIEAVLLSAINTGADGILINPWGECIFLSMQDLEKILAANRAAGDGKKLHVIKDDITKFKGDVIVNAANNTLLGGGGVDGAIHRAAGEALLEECKTLHGCETGQAKMTKGYNLSASYVIHTVGPIYSGKVEDDELLRSCYRNSLNLAMGNNLHTIAFPSISTGVYGYPIGEAAFSACDEMYKWFEEHPDYDIHVTMVCFDQETYERYQTAASMLNAYRHADKYLAEKENNKPQKSASESVKSKTSVQKSKAEGKKLYIKRDTYKATGAIMEKSFVVYKGSGINPQVTGVLPPAIEKLRLELIENGGVDANYILTEDVICTSSSAAAALVVGHTLSGPMSWKNRNGKTLKDIE